MENRYQRLLLAVIVVLGAAVGVATQALAQTITEFPIATAKSVPWGITAGHQASFSASLASATLDGTMGHCTMS